MHRARLLYYFGAGLGLIVLYGCGHTIFEGTKDETGSCIRPVGLIGFTDIDVKVDGSFVGGLLGGGLTISTVNSVSNVIGKSGEGKLVDEYIICRCRYFGYLVTNADEIYLRSKLGFIGTSPSPDQYLQWERDNPPPHAELAVAPKTIRFDGVESRIVTLTNIGDRPLVFWVDNFPARPDGPFVGIPQKGKLAAKEQLDIIIVMSIRRGLNLREDYAFDILFDGRKGLIYTVQIKVKKDEYLGRVKPPINEYIAENDIQRVGP